MSLWQAPTAVIGHKAMQSALQDWSGLHWHPPTQAYRESTPEASMFWCTYTCLAHICLQTSGLTTQNTNLKGQGLEMCGAHTGPCATKMSIYLQWIMMGPHQCVLVCMYECLSLSCPPLQTCSAVVVSASNACLVSNFGLQDCNTSKMIVAPDEDANWVMIAVSVAIRQLLGKWRDLRFDSSKFEQVGSWFATWVCQHEVIVQTHFCLVHDVLPLIIDHLCRPYPALSFAKCLKAPPPPPPLLACRWEPWPALLSWTSSRGPWRRSSRLCFLSCTCLCLPLQAGRC